MNEHDSRQVELGINADRLLADETFALVVNEIANQYMNQIVQTAPQDAKARESAYFGIKALQDVNSTLKQWAHVKDQIIANQGEQDSEE